jgi:hypothetical protein
MAPFRGSRQSVLNDPGYSDLKPFSPRLAVSFPVPPATSRASLCESSRAGAACPRACCSAARRLSLLKSISSSVFGWWHTQLGSIQVVAANTNICWFGFCRKYF